MWYNIKISIILALFYYEAVFEMMAKIVSVQFLAAHTKIKFMFLCMSEDVDDVPIKLNVNPFLVYFFALLVVPRGCCDNLFLSLRRF